MKVGFIGAGNMGGAIIRAICRHQLLNASDELYVSRKHHDLISDYQGLSIHWLCDNKALSEICDCIFLAIKPFQAYDILKEIRSNLDGKLLVSIMAGWSYDHLKELLSESSRIICVMPNTPIMVDQGMTLMLNETNSTEEEFEFIKSIFDSAGKTALVDKIVFEAANGISGCGPAFVYMFIEALADGGVKYGVPRKLAYELAAQTVIGAGEMVLSGNHPAILKDAVCSPNGTTICGIHALENRSFRAAVMDAISAVMLKSKSVL